MQSAVQAEQHISPIDGVMDLQETVAAGKRGNVDTRDREQWRADCSDSEWDDEDAPTVRTEVQLASTSRSLFGSRTSSFGVDRQDEHQGTTS